MSSNKKYWQATEELQEASFVEKIKNNEFREELPVDKFLGNKKELQKTSTTRRDFLKFLGFSTAAASIAACEAPIRKAIPYVVKPEEVTPGQANYYASTYHDANDFASVLIKVREGRPIKIEGNPDVFNFNSVNSRVQASILSLYDSGRAKGPTSKGELITWKDIDSTMPAHFQNIENSGKQIVLMTPTITSPSFLSIISQYKKRFTNFKHIQYDPISYESILNTYEIRQGIRALPSYYFDKAEVVVSFGADFLGDWLYKDFSKGYSSLRNPDKNMSYHIQFESNLSLTGSNADRRVKIRPSERTELLMQLYNLVAEKPIFNIESDQYDIHILEIAKKILANKKKSLIVTGSDDVVEQLITAEINKLILSEGNTLDITHPVFTQQGKIQEVDDLISDMNSGNVGGILIHGVNPVYSLSNGKKFIDGLAKVDLKISFSTKEDETSLLMDYNCPNNHMLESWGDSNPKGGFYTFTQPTISPLFDTRQTEETLMRWGSSKSSYYNFIQDYWQMFLAESFEKGVSSKKVDFNQVLHNGYYLDSNFSILNSFPNYTEETNDLSELLKSINKSPTTPQSEKLELVIYSKVGLGDGSHANNPWLQELPDPISRVTWDNYLTISNVDAKKNGLHNRYVSNGALNASLVNLTLNGVTLSSLPVLIQPGQAEGTVGLALGYGRTSSGKVGDGIGHNAFRLYKGASLNQMDVQLKSIEGEHEFACTQLHHTMMGRNIVKEAKLQDYKQDSKAGNPDILLHTHKGKLTPDEITLWDKHDKSTGHFWNMVIDLNKCTGCGSCVVSCNAENNVPVVGKKEVRKHRDMHWLRIDRYYSSEMNEHKAQKEGLNPIEKFNKMEDPSNNPEVVFQPVMCQHCNNAPCETVCPVAATTHSSEGLNHMAYNRCIGTRYCANNCPYKVRRFNWFNYKKLNQFKDINPAHNKMSSMVLNPDVSVRARGVMEKCSMCIQRIQGAKLQAKKEKRPVIDGEFTTACAAVCDSGAISFGDANDVNSVVSKDKKDNRSYQLLEEVGTRPSVYYKTKIRNKA